MRHRPDATQELGMPPMPVLRGSEVVYSLLLLLKLLLQNLDDGVAFSSAIHHRISLSRT